MINDVLSATQIAEMNDPARYAREEATREATRRAERRRRAKRDVRALSCYREETWASARYTAAVALLGSLESGA